MRQDLERLGVEPGCILIVHASLSAIGWVSGGAQAVVEALLQTIGDTGTLVMPTHSGAGSDPKHWAAPPVPESWWQVIRDHTPAFHRDITPTRQMGAVVECFRGSRTTLRSSHPLHSMAANGPLAAEIVAIHALNDAFGDTSPLGRLYDLDAKVLLLGVGHANNSSLHLAETRAEYTDKSVQWRTQGAAINVDGERSWVEFQEFDVDSADFESLGRDLALKTNCETSGHVGAAAARFMAMRGTVDFATQWFANNRPTP